MRLTSKQKAFHKALVQAVHLSKKYRSHYKDNREDYENVLERAFGVRSSTKLSINDLAILVDWLNGKTDELPEHKPDMITDNQIQMIRDLWSRYAKDKSDTALLKFIYRISKKAYLKLELVPKREATKCITALKHTLGESNGKV